LFPSEPLCRCLLPSYMPMVLRCFVADEISLSLDNPLGRIVLTQSEACRFKKEHTDRHQQTLENRAIHNDPNCNSNVV
jgi:hypothetical protein